MKFFQASRALFSAVNFKKKQGLFAAPNFRAQNSRVQNFARNFNQGGENSACRAQNHINFKSQNFKTEREPWRA